MRREMEMKKAMTPCSGLTPARAKEVTTHRQDIGTRNDGSIGVLGDPVASDKLFRVSFIGRGWTKTHLLSHVIESSEQ